MLMNAAFAAFAAIVGCLVGGLWYVTMRPKRQAEFLDNALSSAQLVIDQDGRARLEGYAARRRRWGAIGGGVGFWLGLLLAVWLHGRTGGRDSIFGVIVMFEGVALGQVLSVRLTADIPLDHARLSTLQPHGLADYLRWREIATETAFAALGLAAAGAGVVVALGGGIDASVGWLVITLGLLVGGVSAGALALQRRLLNAPARADDEACLVTNDMVLAIALRDCAGAVPGTALVAGYLAMLWMHLPLWEMVLALAVGIGVLRLVFDPKLRPDRVPGAHRLAARPSPL